MAAQSEMKKKGARWCFTVNNPGAWRPAWDPHTMEYLVWEMEHTAAQAAGSDAPAQTPHVQGYFVFKTRRLGQSVKGFLTETAHLERAGGTEADNRTYCRKEWEKDHATEIGEYGHYVADRGMQGKRNDIAAATDQIKSGVSMMKVAESCPVVFVKYHGGLEAFKETVRGQGPRERDVHTTVLWGASGVGKTHRVIMFYPEDQIYSCKAGKNCMDRYDGQPVLLLDEFEPDQVNPQELNRWLDKWPCQLDARYSNKTARWTSVYLTSNTDPNHWYSLYPPTVQAAVRRRLLEEPMGKAFHVEDQDDFIDLTWWIGKAAPAPVPPAPVLTPMLPDSPNPAPLKRARAGQNLEDAICLDD